MKIATWNVNSLNVRLPNVLAWIDQAKPDILCLQETKLTDDKFPTAAFEDKGYYVEAHGQKTYNGVALLSLHPMEDVTRGLPGDKSDEQARYVEATIIADDNAVRVASLYLPNGNPVDTDKYPYKLGWMTRLEKRMQKLLALEEALVFAGDYNVIPANEDVHDPEAWADDALFKPETRAQFRRMLNLGFTDSYRACHATPNQYSFWDYQRGAWPKDHGIRIDHLLLSPQAVDLLTGSDIDRDVRSWEKPSDHVPVWCELDI